MKKHLKMKITGWLLLLCGIAISVLLFIPDYFWNFWIMLAAGFFLFGGVVLLVEAYTVDKIDEW